MPPDQVRSYHRAFSTEILIHNLGNVRPYRPIPARTVGWTAFFVCCVFVVVHVLRWPLPMLTLPWVFCYLGVPVALGWVFAAGEVEGRRLHVMVPIWIRHRVSPKQLVGGYRVATPGPQRLKARRRVRVW